MNMTKRKNNRITGFDYSTNGYYFITICSKEKKKIFGNINFEKEAEVNLNEKGKIVEKYLHNIEELDKYIIMPNHLHLIIKLENDKENKSIQRIISGFKRAVSITLGESPWQKSFYDRVIRNEKEYQNIWNYIEYNAEKWREDEYYIP